MKTQAFNPFLPSYEYIPDAEPYVFGNRVYIYGSHDRFNGEDFCMITCAGQRRLMIWGHGKRKALFTVPCRIR